MLLRLISRRVELNSKYVELFRFKKCPKVSFVKLWWSGEVNIFRPSVKFNLIFFLRNFIGNQPSGQSIEGLSINAFELSTRQKICKRLNEKVASGNDFRKLAEHARMSKDHVDLVCEERNPTGLVLSWWAQQPEGTISNLRRTLLLMGRLDCVRILDKGRKSGMFFRIHHKLRRLCILHRCQIVKYDTSTNQSNAKTIVLFLNEVTYIHVFRYPAVQTFVQASAP